MEFKKKNLTYEMHKLLSLPLPPLFSRPMHKTFEKTRTLHIVHEHFEILSDGKLHCFRNNTGIRINISSLSASTLIRECVFFFVLLFRYSKTEGYRDISIWSFGFKSFFLFAASNPETREKAKEEDRKLC